MAKGTLKAIAKGTAKEYLKLQGYDLDKLSKPQGTWKDVAKFLGLVFAVFLAVQMIIAIANCR